MPQRKQQQAGIPGTGIKPDGPAVPQSGTLLGAEGGELGLDQAERAKPGMKSTLQASGA